MIASYAQYLRDHMDVTVLLKHARNVTMDEAFDLAGPYLRDIGWQGRTYPLDFFRAPAAAVVSPAPRHGAGTGDLSDPQMGELPPRSPFDGGPWRPC